MKLNYPVENTVFLLLIAVLNMPSLIDSSAVALFPSALFHGEIWRWFTYPWAHISIYHLVLDTTTFFFLYDMLRGKAPVRLFHLLSSILFSGLLPVLLDPRLESIGLRGLSGVSHGLMMVVALQSLSSKVKLERTLGVIVLAVVVAKCLVEVLAGTVLFASWHLGDVGLPVPTCHLGGAIGGALSFWLATWLLTKQSPGQDFRCQRDVGPHLRSAGHWRSCDP